MSVLGAFTLSDTEVPPFTGCAHTPNLSPLYPETMVLGSSVLEFRGQLSF